MLNMGPSYTVYELITSKSGLDDTNVTKARDHTCFKNSQQKDCTYIYFCSRYVLIFLHVYIKNNYSFVNFWILSYILI